MVRQPLDPLATPMWDSADAVRFIGAEGIEWRVLERDTTLVPGAIADRCLVFLSSGLARRVWRYPSRWQALSAIELELLSEAT